MTVYVAVLLIHTFTCRCTKTTANIATVMTSLSLATMAKVWKKSSALFLKLKV